MLDSTSCENLTGTRGLTPVEGRPRNFCGLFIDDIFYVCQ